MDFIDYFWHDDLFMATWTINVNCTVIQMLTIVIDDGFVTLFLVSVINYTQKQTKEYKSGKPTYTYLLFEWY